MFSFSAKLALSIERTTSMIDSPKVRYTGIVLCVVCTD
jgi:hypothetical protein